MFLLILYWYETEFIYHCRSFMKVGNGKLSKKYKFMSHILMFCNIVKICGFLVWYSSDKLWNSPNYCYIGVQRLLTDVPLFDNATTIEFEIRIFCRTVNLTEQDID